MEYKVAVLPGDGIGPEIVREARKVMEKLSESGAFLLIFRKSFSGERRSMQSESLFRRRLLRLVKIVMRY